jgi:hypothetical protein
MTVHIHISNRDYSYDTGENMISFISFQVAKYLQIKGPQKNASFITTARTGLTEVAERITPSDRAKIWRER